jgi:very-short-patch-repair endonuclease
MEKRETKTVEVLCCLRRFIFPPYVKGGQGGFGGFHTMLPFNRTLKAYARDLRKNMTDAESFLWAGIRKKQLKGFQFYRQKNIGKYIVDFYCPAAKLIIEVDGGQHYAESGKEGDNKRDAYMQSLGFRVLRFSDIDVLKDLTGVLTKIYGEMP